MKYTPFRHRKLLLAILITTLAHGIAHAEVAELEAVIVTASPEDSRALHAIQVDEAEVRTRKAATSDTASLLKFIPGVSLYGSGGVSSLPAIRGLADDRLRIKVDGMDLVSACGNHMNPPLSYIDPTSVERIEVFAGIAPVSAGGDSIGGTILVESAPPEFAAPGAGTLRKGEVGAYYRSNGSAYGGHLAATQATETLSLSYRGSTAQSDNYKAGDEFKPAGLSSDDVTAHWLDGDEVGSSMYKTVNHALGFALRNEDHQLELKLGLQDIPYQGWPNQRMDMTRNDSTQINLRHEGQFDWGTLETRIYHENTRHSMQFYKDKKFWYHMTQTVPGMPMETEGKNTGARVQGEIELSARDLLRVGGEYQRYRLDDWWPASGDVGGMQPDDFININDGERDRLVAFAEWEARWNGRWLTQFGARVEHVSMDTGPVQGYNAMAQYPVEAAAFNASDRSRSDDNLDLTALARYTPDATRSVEFGYARKTRSPNLYERYTWSTGGMAMRMINWFGDGNGYVGNLELEPEVAHTLSASFDWHDAARQQWALKLTPYYTYVEDYIDVRRCASDNMNCGPANLTATESFVYLQFVNQSASLYGVDLSGSLELGESDRYGRFSATGVVNYVRGKNETTDDNLYNIMPLNARLALVQQVERWTNSVEVELVDAKSRVSDVRNEVETSGYGLLHLRSSREWKQVRLDMGIENVFDRYYELPLGGVYTGQGNTMSGDGIAWGTPVPGMGRSFYAGLTLRF